VEGLDGVAADGNAEHATHDAWIVQAAYPAIHSSGTTDIYGRACHHHVCPFTRLKDSQVGDIIQVTTLVGVLTYRIDRIGSSAKKRMTVDSGVHGCFPLRDRRPGWSRAATRGAGRWASHRATAHSRARGCLPASNQLMARDCRKNGV
jgi:hypothetical protein